jgi:hypothetical protein
MGTKDGLGTTPGFGTTAEPTPRGRTPVRTTTDEKWNLRCRCQLNAKEWTGEPRDPNAIAAVKRAITLLRSEDSRQYELQVATLARTLDVLQRRQRPGRGIYYRVLIRDKVAQCFQVAFRDTIREDE